MKYEERFHKTLDFLLSKKNWFYLAILSLPFTIPDIFKEPVPNSTSTDYLVFRLLSAVKSSTLLDTVFWIIVLLLFISFFRKCCRNYQGSFRYFLIILVLTTWYCYISFFDSSEWNILTLNSLTCLRYTDLIIFHWFLLLFTLIINFFKSKKSKEDDSSGFITDAPNKNNDDFRRKELAEKLAKRLIKTQNNDQSFGVGIVGQWGSGKTTFLNFIEKWIDDNNKADNIIVINFNAWQFDNSAILIDDFFNTLKSKLVIFNPELGSKISDYTDHLVNLESNFFTKLSQIGINSLGKENSLDSLFTDINDTIKTLNKKVIVFIDDLDRLDKREVIEVIRLIRNTANFANTIFIVAYDRGYITNAIKGISDYNHEAYLDKIFQIEVELPKIEHITISYYLKNKLTEKLSEQSILVKEYFTYNKEFPSKNVNLAEVIISIREANRIINSFLLAHDSLQDEIDIIDLFNIEILRIKYPKIYLLLRREKRNDWLTSNGSLDISFSPLKNYIDLEATYQLRKTEKREFSNIPSNKTILEEFLENERKKDKWQLSDADVSNIFIILNTIFHGEPRSSLSIVYPHNFDRYFNYRLFERNLPTREFEDALQKLPVEQFLEKIEEWTKQDRTKDLIIKLKDYTNTEDTKHVNKLKKIIHGAFELRGLNEASFSNSEIYDIIKIIGKEISTPLFQDFIKKLFTKSQRLFTHQWYFLEDLIDDYSIISKEIQIDILFYQLQHLTKKEPGLTSTIWSTYITLIKKEPNHKPANELFLSFVKSKDPIGLFTDSLIEQQYHPVKYRIKDESIIYRTLFNNDLSQALDFYNGIKTPELTSQISEIVKFIQMSQSQNLKPIDFDFVEVNLERNFRL